MADSPAGLLKGARILVVEDNPLIAVDLSYGLRDAGAEVVGPFAHARTALPMAQADGLSAAVLDVNLADGTVTPVARALIERDVPVVFCTGVALPDDLRARLPNAVVMQKPCDTAEVAATLARLMSARDTRS